MEKKKGTDAFKNFYKKGRKYFQLSFLLVIIVKKFFKRDRFAGLAQDIIKNYRFSPNNRRLSLQKQKTMLEYK